MKRETLLVKGELIGKKVKIVKCTDPSWIGREGKIVDETKNTFKIEINGKEKVIAKDTAVFEFTIGDNVYYIDGLRLRYRPEERIKKAR